MMIVKQKKTIQWAHRYVKAPLHWTKKSSRRRQNVAVNRVHLAVVSLSSRQWHVASFPRRQWSTFRRDIEMTNDVRLNCMNTELYLWESSIRYFQVQIMFLLKLVTTYSTLLRTLWHLSFYKRFVKKGTM